MEVLNVRTENAIASLVRERIEAAQKLAKAKKGGTSDGGEEMGIEVVTLVEGMRVREREEQLEEQGEREDEELA
jgi:coiled-coil domain-containing protein 12